MLRLMSCDVYTKVTMITKTNSMLLVYHWQYKDHVPFQICIFYKKSINPALNSLHTIHCIHTKPSADIARITCFFFSNFCFKLLLLCFLLVQFTPMISNSNDKLECPTWQESSFKYHFINYKNWHSIIATATSTVLAKYVNRAKSASSSISKINHYV